MNQEFKHESLQDRESIVKYLNALSEGISNGHLLFGTDRKRMVLEPKGLLNLGIKARRKDNKIKLQLKLSWLDGKDNKKGESLVIKASENE